MIFPETMSFNTSNVKVYLAAAGCGKTSALMDEMTEQLKIYRPDEIAFVTYTRKGVATGRRRAVLANPELKDEDLVYFRTLHSLCFHELGLTDKNIIAWADMKKFNKVLGYHITLRQAYENLTNDDKLLIRYDALRSGSKKSIYIHGIYDEMRYQRLIRAYERFKQVTEKVDFYDCLKKFCERGKPLNVKVAFIDEAQDLTLLQWEACKIAFLNCEKIIISGDDFQCLFSYQGASPQTLIHLSEKYKTIRVEKSYRLSNEVYKFTKGITNIISQKIEKDYKPVKNIKGFVEDVTDRDFLNLKVMRDLIKGGYQPGRWYYLFRNNCFIDQVANDLDRLLIPYHTTKGFCINERDLAKIKRYYNFRKTGFSSKESLENFCKKYEIKDINDDFTESKLIPNKKQIIYFAYIEKFGIDALIEMSGKEPFLLLSTTHKVKGGEADYVSVFLDCTQKVYHNQQVNVDEELRVLYVACSRARNGLYIVHSMTKYGLDRVIEVVKEQVA